MIKALLRRIARRCDIHDVASPLRINELEALLGVEMTAWQRDLVERLYDPDLLDCGRSWCRERRHA